MAGTANATVARRALARSLRSSSFLLEKLSKRSALEDLEDEGECE